MTTVKKINMKDYTKIELYHYFTENIKEKRNFSFSRWGDGEWALVLKKEPTYSHLQKKWGEGILKKGKDLEDILLKDPEYIIGVQPLSLNMWNDDIQKITDRLNTVNSDVLHHNSYKNNLGPFIESLKTREVIIVGYQKLRELNFFKFEHVETPELYVWDAIEKIKEDLIKVIKGKNDPVILYSCSIAANILIDHFYDLFGKSITQIDTGSMWDPYIGVNSRSYHMIVIDRLGIPKDTITSPRIK